MIEGHIVGGYKILDTLGSGGMATVFRAEPVDGGEQVAVKTVRGVSARTSIGIRREIRALHAIRHPGIVAILDSGEYEGLPWYAMDLVPGDTLGRVLERHGGETRSDWWTRTLSTQDDTVPAEVAPEESKGIPFEEVLRLSRALCDGLAYLHGEGLVHRDLKPDNIILRDGEQPVLVDFGLASVQRARTREKLDVREDFVGTAAYMAPEIIRGETADARADLYALGCILFELATGQRPFPAYTTEAMLRGHLEASPPRPSGRVPTLPKAFDQLVEKLLRKDPRERVGHADDVGRALQDLGAERPDWSPPAARPYLYRPGFVGRAEALRSLEASLERACEGQGGLGFVAGESGIGKTRTANELGIRAARAGVDVLQGECPSRGGSPLEAFHQPLERLVDRCREHPETALSLFASSASILAQLVPSIATLPGLEVATPAPLRGAESRARLFEALATTLVAATESGPLLIVLDDLQWADELTYDALRYLAREVLSNVPLLVVGTFRTDEASPALRSLAQPYACTRLGHLASGDVRALVQDMLAHPAPRVSDYVGERSDGNPFFVAEYLLAALEAGLLQRDANGGWALREGGDLSVPLPRGLRALMVRRLSHVSENARTTLAAAAVLEDFDLRVLSDVARVRREERNSTENNDSSDVLSAIDELTRRHVLVEHGGSLHFAHDKLREAAYDEIRPELRRLLHRRAAQTLLESASPDILGHHWRAAGEPQRAIEAFAHAADTALMRGAHRHAVQRYQDAEALAADDDPRRASWEVGLGEAMMGLGEFDAGRKHLLSSLARRGDHPRTGPSFALGLAAQIGRQALRPRADVSTTDALGMARAYQRLVETYWFDSDLPRMLDAALRALNLAESAPASPELARAYATMAVAAGGIPLHSVARGYVGRAKRAALHVGDPAATSYVHFIASVYHAGVGAWATLDDDLERAAALCLEIGDRRFHGESQTVMGMSSLYRGNFIRARACFESVATAGRQFENLQHRVWAALGIAECELREGALERARRSLDAAAAELESFPQAAELYRLEGLRARERMRAGDPAGAMDAVQRAFPYGQALPVPTAHYLLEGYGGVAETLLELAPRSAETRSALAKMQLFASIFPIGQARSRRLWAQWLRHQGQARLAKAAMQTSLRHARRLKMSFEAERANEEILG